MLYGTFLTPRVCVGHDAVMKISIYDLDYCCDSFCLTRLRYVNCCAHSIWSRHLERPNESKCASAVVVDPRVNANCSFSLPTGSRLHMCHVRMNGVSKIGYSETGWCELKHAAYHLPSTIGAPLCPKPAMLAKCRSLGLPNIRMYDSYRSGTWALCTVLYLQSICIWT